MKKSLWFVVACVCAALVVSCGPGDVINTMTQGLDHVAGESCTGTGGNFCAGTQAPCLLVTQYCRSGAWTPCMVEGSNVCEASVPDAAGVCNDATEFFPCIRGDGTRGVFCCNTATRQYDTLACYAGTACPVATPDAGPDSSVDASDASLDAMDVATDASSDIVTDATDASDAPDAAEACVPSTEVCNGIDDNCNGLIDELLPVISCGTGACFHFVPSCAGGVPQTCTPLAPIAEVCNGIDDDCNGVIDDGLGITTCGTGACVSTTLNCIAGVPRTCTPGTPVAETCNGIDDNCNGVIDDGLGSTTCGVGACLVTQQNCVGGTPRACVPGTPVAETCNGIDDNCNGVIDDGLGSSTCGVGACARTVQNCVGGVVQTCTAGSPTAEVCNNIDDNCNGLVDDGLGTTTCGVGACSRTVNNCVAGVVQSCLPGSPATETCNNIDDNCNGAIDEGVTQACYTGPTGTSGRGACHGGAQACTAGVFSGACVGQVVPTTEICNGIDDDCNGIVDDGLGTTTCGTGACIRTVQNCVGGFAQTCVAGSPTAEICNNIDDNCNGSVDEGVFAACWTGSPTQRNIGICRDGTFACTAGIWSTTCVGQTMPAVETCNNADDNCDGAVDNVGTTTCGAGACARTVQVCIAGVPQTCTPGTPTTEICNGIDDNCNGSIDEALGTTTCGVGACQRTVANCVAGTIQACTPASPTAEICGNSIDDNCNGIVDDGCSIDAGVDSGTDSGTDASADVATDVSLAIDAGSSTRYIVWSSSVPCTSTAPIAGLTDVPGYTWYRACYQTTSARPTSIVMAQYCDFDDTTNLPTEIPAISVPSGTGYYTINVLYRISNAATQAFCPNARTDTGLWAVGFSSGTTRQDIGTPIVSGNPNVMAIYRVVGGVQTPMTTQAIANGPCTGLNYHPQGTACAPYPNPLTCTISPTYPCN